MLELLEWMEVLEFQESVFWILELRTVNGLERTEALETYTPICQIDGGLNCQDCEEVDRLKSRCIGSRVSVLQYFIAAHCSTLVMT